MQIQENNGFVQNLQSKKISLCANKLWRCMLVDLEFMFCDLHQLLCVDKDLVGGQFYYLHQRHEYSDGQEGS